MKLPLTFLGSGSCFNTQWGNTSAYFFPEPSTLVLIDCGESVFERIVKHNLLSGVQHLVVVITHLHSDHVGSLPSLLFLAQFTPTVLSQTVVCESKSDLQTLLTLCGSPKSTLLTAKEWQARHGVHIEAFPAKHGNMPASSFLFQTTNSAFYYSGDTQVIHPQLNNYLSTGKLDFVFHEASLHGNGMHTPIADLEAHFSLQNRSKVFCMHIPSSEEAKLFLSKGFEVALPCEKQGNNSCN